MRVVLVHPTGSNWIPGRKDLTVTVNRMVPIGLLSMAAYLEAKGVEVLVHDCLGPGAPGNVDANVARILSLEPQLVGFSATTSGFLDAYEMARKIREARPAVKNVFGGIHVSGVGAQLMERFPGDRLSGVGRGRGHPSRIGPGREPSRRSKVWSGVTGTNVVTNPLRELVRDLDSLPFPAYQKLKGFPRGYHLPPFSYIRTPGTAISTSRGCIYQCSYCDRSVFKKGFRSNSADYTYEHLEYLRKQVRNPTRQHLRRPLHGEPQANSLALPETRRGAARSAVQLRGSHRAHG